MRTSERRLCHLNNAQNLKFAVQCEPLTRGCLCGGASVAVLSSVRRTETMNYPTAHRVDRYVAIAVGDCDCEVLEQRKIWHVFHSRLGTRFSTYFEHTKTTHKNCDTRPLSIQLASQKSRSPRFDRPRPGVGQLKKWGTCHGEKQISWAQKHRSHKRTGPH